MSKWLASTVRALDEWGWKSCYTTPGAVYARRKFHFFTVRRRYSDGGRYFECNKEGHELHEHSQREDSFEKGTYSFFGGMKNTIYIGQWTCHIRWQRNKVFDGIEKPLELHNMSVIFSSESGYLAGLCRNRSRKIHTLNIWECSDNECKQSTAANGAQTWFWNPCFILHLGGVCSLEANASYYQR